jgi:multimeric flavodoxin WrbA
MKKITAFIGTKSKKATYLAVQEFEKNLKKFGEIDFEYVLLSDYHLEFCQGCKQCFIKGEEFCPAKDDRDILLAKMENSDGVIFATPNYAFHVSGRMKNFIDRLAFNYHRPRFFGKAFTAIVAQGFLGGNTILKYLYGVGENLGFHISKGCCVTSLDPLTELQHKKLLQKTKKAAAAFYQELLRPLPVPSFLRLMIFRMGRTNVKFVDQNFRDYQYYKEKGWLESDYFYATSLGLMKKLAGNLFDFMGRQMVKRQ